MSDNDEEDNIVGGNGGGIIVDLVYRTDGTPVVLREYPTHKCTAIGCKKSTILFPHLCTRHFAAVTSLKIELPKSGDIQNRKGAHVFAYHEKMLGRKSIRVMPSGLQLMNQPLFNANVVTVENALKVPFHICNYDRNRPETNDYKLYKIETMTGEDYDEIEAFMGVAQDILPYQRVYGINSQLSQKYFLIIKKHWFGDYIRRTDSIDEYNCEVVVHGSGTGQSFISLVRKQGHVFQQYEELILLDWNAKELQTNKTFAIRGRINPEDVRNPLSALSKQSTNGNIARENLLGQMAMASQPLPANDAFF